MLSFLRISTAVGFAVFMAGANAAPLDLSRIPPELNASLPPNIMVTLDDSGSMGFGFTPDLVDSQSCFYRRPMYYSPAFNKQYYDPTVTYEPPLDINGDPMPTMSFNSAKINGFDMNAGAPRINLGTQYRVSWWEGIQNFNRTVITHSTSLSPATGWPMGPSGCNTAQAADKYARFPFDNAAFYYRYTGSMSLPNIDTTASNFTAVNVSVASGAQRTNFANWFSYYRTRGLAARSALSTVFARVDPNTRVAWQNLTREAIVNDTRINAITDGSTWRQNFFSWIHTSWNEFKNHPGYSGSYSSYATPMRAASIRAGNFFTRSGSNTRNPYWDAGYGRELSCRQNFHMLVTDGYWNEDNPSWGHGDTDATAITLPDGRAYSTSSNASRVFWRQQAWPGTNGTGCNSSNNSLCQPTLADIAFRYWSTDLRTDTAMPNNVPSYFADRSTGLIAGATPEDEVYFNPANDPANWQRMVSFIIGFGVSGTLTYSAAGPVTKAQRLLRLRQGVDQWPYSTNNSERTIDDSWHAAINSRGDYLSAGNPQELVDALASVLDNVSRRQGVTGSAGSTSFLRSDTVQYQASYDSGSWLGDIIAEEIDEDTGEPTGVLAWPNSAGAQLDARTPGSRNIFVNTRAPTAANAQADAEPFLWGSDLGDIQTSLSIDPLTGSTDVMGPQRLAWIRGDRSVEQSSGGPMRNRTSVLGPFIGSSLINVAAPRFGYRGREDFDEGGIAYATFRNDHVDRQAVIYIGGNDGMLHAFDAETGHELWAYIPNRVSHNLARLTTPAYQFVPFVNATPVDHDVYFDGEGWRTVLVGTLGLGGQGVYAIDVTDPANPDFLWEVTDAIDSRLGYTYGRPNVGRLSDGTWVAFVSAGYNSEATVDYATRGMPNAGVDSHAASGESVGAVFVIRMSDGQVQRIDLPQARGLATVQLADYELDYKVDFAVGGDLNGNLWRIDLAGLTWGNVNGAHVERLFTGNVVSGVPQHPITSAPSIFNDPATGKMVVVVGTGKYIEENDRETAIPRQRIYGIRECGPSCATYPISQGTLVEQTITSTHTAGGHEYLNMTQTNVVPPTRNGWYVQLGNTSLLSGRLTGERVVDMSVPISFPSGIVALGSFIPSNDPCSPLGDGAIYALSAATGGFAFPGDLNAGGTAYQPGEAIFPGGTNQSVGRLVGRRVDLSAFLNPDGGNMTIMGVSVNGVPVRRRSGWREIPLE